MIRTSKLGQCPTANGPRYCKWGDYDFRKMRRLLRAGRINEALDVGDILAIPVKGEGLDEPVVCELVVTGFNQFSVAPERFVRFRGGDVKGAVAWRSPKNDAIIYTKSKAPGSGCRVWNEILIWNDSWHADDAPFAGQICVGALEEPLFEIQVNFRYNIGLEFTRCMEESYYRGSDRWSGFSYDSSLVRQWLNCEDDGGFTSRLPKEFIKLLGRRMWRDQASSKEDGSGKGSDETFADMFWMASRLEVGQNYDMEGSDAKERAERARRRIKTQWNDGKPQTSPGYYWLRDVDRDDEGHELSWCVNPQGKIESRRGDQRQDVMGIAPSCVIV